MNLIKNDFLISMVAPALLGGIFGILVYLGVNPIPGSLPLALIFAAGGVLSGLALTFGLRRFLEPHRKKDTLE